ncbi:MAG: hypothetical protein JWM89_607 [Acidimicrobiales bacterium]|nr:hypothetical protein [Acidimicrobiales bacterium]
MVVMDDDDEALSAMGLCPHGYWQVEVDRCAACQGELASWLRRFESDEWGDPAEEDL